MKTSALVILLLTVVFCTNALAGLGEPLSSDSSSPAQRKAIADRLAGNNLIRSISSAIGGEKVNAVFERLPDGDLEAISRNLDTVMSGGSTTIGELFVSLLLIVAVLGLLLLLIMVLGIAALFAGGAAATSGKRSAPMGKAQYEEQRQKTEDTKELAKPDQQK